MSVANLANKFNANSLRLLLGCCAEIMSSFQLLNKGGGIAAGGAAVTVFPASWSSGASFDPSNGSFGGSSAGAGFSFGSSGGSDSTAAGTAAAVFPAAWVAGPSFEGVSFGSSAGSGFSFGGSAGSVGAGAASVSSSAAGAASSFAFGSRDHDADGDAAMQPEPGRRVGAGPAGAFSSTAGSASFGTSAPSASAARFNADFAEALADTAPKTGAGGAAQASGTTATAAAAKPKVICRCLPCSLLLTHHRECPAFAWQNAATCCEEECSLPMIDLDNPKEYLRCGETACGKYMHLECFYVRVRVCARARPPCAFDACSGMLPAR